MAFHPYPQVIAAVFNRRAFGPPRGLTPASACPRIAHPASRPRRGTQVALLRLAFATARFVAWPRHAPQLAGSFYKRHAVTPASRCSDCLWAGGFRCCFTPLPGCFSPFPRGTSALSVTGEYLGLEGGPPCFPPGFTCPAVLGHRQAGVALRVRGSNPLRPGFPSGSARAPLCNRTVDGPTTPARLSLGPVWPLPRSLATTGGISLDFSSSGYLDVSVPRVAPRRAMSSPGG